jgi:hypothetical protein
MATVMTEDGSSVVGRPVEFVESVDFFGKRVAVLGTAVTDSDGWAAVTYQPSTPGDHTIVARMAGSRRYAESNARLSLQVQEVVAPFTEESPRLADIGTWLAVALVLLGVVFWAVLLGVTTHAIWRIRTAAAAMGLPVAAQGDSGKEVPI